MQMIYNWHIKRAGAGLTIEGIGTEGDPVKIVEAEKIVVVGRPPGDGSVIFAYKDSKPVAELHPLRRKLVL